MDDYTKVIIDKLAEGYKFDYVTIALGLAKHDPALFCELAGITESVSQYYKVIDPWLRSGNLISAIKALRDVTRWDLKKSKDFCCDRKALLGL